VNKRPQRCAWLRRVACSEVFVREDTCKQAGAPGFAKVTS
jgi:hypothetical protein